MMRRVFPVFMAALACAPLPISAQPAVAETQATSAPTEPARQAAADRVVGRLLPDGTYQRMMRDSVDKMLVPMMDQMFDTMPMGEIARMTGLEPDKAAALDKTTLGEVMAIVDPHFRERTNRGMRASIDLMTGMMSDMEPRMRAGLGRAYARKFTVQQLDELDRFFATPTGTLYASESLVIFTDPEIVKEMQAFIPELMKRMPDIVKQMETATADLPKPRKLGDLSKAERARLARLLGMKPEEMREQETRSEEIGD